MTKRDIYATATLIGAIVGVGIFGVPYVTVQSGLSAGLFYIGLLTAAMLMIHLLYGEVEERTEGQHRLTGHAQMYLGMWGKWAVGALVVLGGYGALLAYLIVGGEFLDILMPGVASPFIWTIVFWAAGSYAVWRGMRIVGWGELVMTVALVIAMFVIVAKGAGHIVPEHITGTASSLRGLLRPYGVVLFSLVGISAIPEVRAVLGRHDGARFRWVIIWGTLVPAILYVFFTITVVGVSGGATSEEAIRGLVPLLGGAVATAGALFGFLAVATSFLVFGINLKNTYIYDWGAGKMGAFLLVAIVPALLFLAGMREFILIIGVTGALLGALSGPIVIALHARARKQGLAEPGFTFSPPRAVLYMVGALFIVGGIYEIVASLGIF